MAVGFPVKADYATGDVLSAANMNDLSGTVNLLQSTQYAAGKNAIINGGFDIWQRGTSFASLTAASSSTFAADRWQVYIGNAGRTVSQQASGLTAFRYSMRVARDSGNTSTAVTQVTQNIESNMSYPLAGKTVTVSFYGKAGANYSAASGALTYALYQGTGIDQNVFGMTGGSVVGTGTATLTTSWQRFSLSVTVPITSTELAVYFSTTPVGTAGANDWFEITGIQLEVGSTATAFSRTGGTIQGELAACQRYYQRIVDGANQWIGAISYYQSTFIENVTRFIVQMRIAPSLVITTGTDYYSISRNGATDTLNSLTIYQPTTQSTYLYNNTEASGTAGHAGMLFSNNASSSIAFSAEL
jgi:hypothetical protein